jgi:FAD/FMN-containing dehydrogenase
VDPEAIGLEADLRARIRGEVRFDDGTRALYCNDGSNYRQVPIVVVIPRDADNVVETIAVRRQYGAPIVPRGGGTSLAGQVINVAVVIDMSKYMRDVLAVQPERKVAVVQPGCVLDDLRNLTEARYNLTLPPDPATHAWCTIGGMIGNNSCGPHSFLSDRAGRMAEHVEEMEIVTYDGLRLRVGQTTEAELDRIIGEGGRRGAIYAKLKRLRDQYADRIRERFLKLPRLVSGYALDQLLPENGFNVAAALVGTEGTCATILEATTRLVHKPPQQVLLLLTYDDVYAAGDHVP